jgi:hypothetical protein
VVGLLVIATLGQAFIASASASSPAGLKVSSLAGGAIEVTDDAVFDVVFDPAQEGGITRLYNPTADPSRANNLGPAAGYTVFDTYLNQSGWANIARGQATTFEVLRNSPGSVVIHALGQFMHEDGSGPVAGLQHETWTTLYPGGRVFLQRRLTIGGAPLSVANFGGKAVDVSTATNWWGIYTGVAGDVTFGSGTNAYAGNGKEGWIGFYSRGPPQPSASEWPPGRFRTSGSPTPTSG